MAELEKNIIPCGGQNLADLRRRGLCCVDKTPFIRELELRSDIATPTRLRASKSIPPPRR